MWKTRGSAGLPTDDTIIWHMRFACFGTKATKTHIEYVIIIAFPWHQWSSERTSVLRYTYIDCLVIIQRGSKRWTQFRKSIFQN